MMISRLRNQILQIPKNFKDFLVLSKSAQGYFILYLHPHSFRNNLPGGARFDFVSQGFLTMTGSSPGELYSRPEQAIKNFFHPRFLEELNKYLIPENETVFHGVVPIQKDGKTIRYYSANISIAPVKHDAFLLFGLLAEISDNEQDSPFMEIGRFVTKSLKADIFIQDEAGNYIYTQLSLPKTKKWHGKIKNAQNFKEVLPPWLVEKEEKLLQRVKQTRRKKSHTYFFNGKYFHATLHPYTSNTYVKVVEDISEKTFSKIFNDFSSQMSLQSYSVQEFVELVAKYLKKDFYINNMLFLQGKHVSDKMVVNQTIFNTNTIFEKNIQPLIPQFVSNIQKTIWTKQEINKVLNATSSPSEQNFSDNVCCLISKTVFFEEQFITVIIEIPVVYDSRLPYCKYLLLILNFFENEIKKISLQEATKKQQQYLQTLTENISDIVLHLNYDGTILYISKPVEEKTGYAVKELVGKKWQDLIHPEDLPEFKQKYKEFISRKKECEATYRIKTKKGNVLWMRSRGKKLHLKGFSGVLTTIHDITDVYEYSEIISEQNKILKMLISKATVGVIYVFDGKIIEANAFFEKEFGVSEEEMKSVPLKELFVPKPSVKGRISVHERQWVILQQQIDKIFRTSAEIVFSMKVQDKKGTYKTYRISGAPMLYGGEQKGQFFIVQNISGLEEEKQTHTKISIQAQEEERHRIGHELHDGLGQMLTANSFFMHTLKHKIDKLNNPQLSADISKALHLFEKCLKETRAISHALRPATLDKFGLAYAIKELEEISSGIKVSFNTNLYPLRFESTLELNLFRIIQELLTNAYKHGEATEFKIRLTYFPNRKKLVLITQDNGKGFDIEKAWSKQSGIGYEGIKTRAFSIGAEMHVTSVNQGFNGVKHTFIVSNIEPIKTYSDE
ncbi:MAG: PAS domain S-box protein [Bacteroidetes bacterium]|nr:MAG: PAS domain S-box protein [Bacteroidota bacterium]